MHKPRLAISQGRRRKAVAIATATVLLAGVGIASAATPGVGALAVSLKTDRSSAQSLAGATLKGDAYIFLNRDNVSQVTFSLDGKQVSVERVAPFDLETTAADGSAKPLDTKTLAKGSHKIVAVATTTSHRTRSFSATFQVDNSVVGTTTTTTVKPTTTTSKPTTTLRPTTTTAKPTTTTVKPTTTTTKPTTTTVAPTTTVPTSSGSWPSASTTGVPAGTVLKASGSLSITADNTVIDGYNITGTVDVYAKNVVIKNSKIHDGGYYGVFVRSGNATIMDSEIYNVSAAAIAFDNWTAIRVNIHGMAEDGVKLGDNTTLQDSYIHDFTGEPGAHGDGVQLQGGVKNATVRHNYIVPLSPATPENSALFMAPDLGPSGTGPVVIDNNLLGGGNYTLFILDGASGTYHQSGYSVTNNHFLRNGRYGAIDINEPASSFTAWSGNVYDDNGAAINR